MGAPRLDNLRLGILTAYEDKHQPYLDACRELGVDHEVVDILGADWLENLRTSQCDGFLARPPCANQEMKTLYDERLYFLSHHLDRPLYPSYDELFLYENKRAMAYWLQTHDYPHAATRVFTRKAEALAHLSRCSYPVVLKANVGAAASQVRVVPSAWRAKWIARRVFGLIHPAMTMGYIGYRFRGLPLPLWGKAQRHYLVVQQFEPIKWEWRIIKIGDSYFGHQKLLEGQYASGSDKVGWVAPPEQLLELVGDVCARGGFYSMALDVFETEDGRFLINELQSIFGSINDSQMYIDGTPGRFRRQDGKFVFEEGLFNRHGSYLLRVEHFVALLSGEPSPG